MWRASWPWNLLHGPVHQLIIVVICISYGPIWYKNHPETAILTLIELWQFLEPCTPVKRILLSFLYEENIWQVFSLFSSKLNIYSVFTYILQKPLNFNKYWLNISKTLPNQSLLHCQLLTTHGIPQSIQLHQSVKTVIELTMNFLKTKFK